MKIVKNMLQMSNEEFDILFQKIGKNKVDDEEQNYF